MAFVKKTWKDRIVQYANRRLLTKSGGEVEQVTVTRDEGTISEAGDQFNASNMNNLEQRVKDGFDDTKDYIDNGLSGKADSSTLLTNIFKKYRLTGTTNASGDIIFDYKNIGDCIIVSATKVRNSANSNIGFSSIGRNATNDRYIVHLVDASSSPLANQNVEVIVHYVEFY